MEKNYDECDMPIKLTCDIDFNNSKHYEYICGFLEGFLDPYVFYLISYIFGKFDIIREHEQVNYKIILDKLNSMGFASIMQSITCEILQKINVKIVCFCASHIADTDRLEKLENMLNSWKKQIYKTKFVLSISCVENNVLHVNNKLEYFKEKFGENLIILNNQINKKSQFEHYHNICNLCKEQFDDYWIYFSDDDDIWSKKRSFVFGLMLQNIINANVQEKISYLEYPFMCEGDTYVSSNEEVVLKMMTNEIQMKNRNESGSLEYVCYSLKFNDFYNFLIKCESNVLKHVLCDRFFIKYLRMCPNINKSVMMVPFFGFSYYYFNNKYLGQKNKMLESYDQLDEIAKYIVILYYSFKINDNSFVRHIKSYLNEVHGELKIQYHDQIIKKCLFLLKENICANFKLSPILTDGIINGKQEIYIYETFHRNDGKLHCSICKITSDVAKLIKIINSSEKNRKICVDCINCHNEIGINFSKIKDGKVKMLKR